MTDGSYRLGAFELGRRLGQGGMAEVWSGTHTQFGGSAAVKLMLGGAESEREQELFFSEARSHAGLEHPNVVGLLDYGHVDEDDAPPPDVEVGHPYLVMELADGTLADFPITSYAQLFDVLMQVLDGLAYSHARGVVHRDLKPANVLVFSGQHPTRFKLADFGVAHSLQLDETADSNNLAMTIGTPQYMAPEQARGRWYDYGPWTDLYALGCIAFEFAAGIPPFTGSTGLELVMKHLREPVPPLKPQFDVPERFEAWTARALAKEPSERFRWAAEAARSLVALSRGFEPGESVAVTAPFAGDATTVAGDASTELFDTVSSMTTLVDSLDDLVTAETVAAHVALAPQREEAELAEEAESVEPIEVGPVSLPASWRRPVAREGGLANEGLGLFALREDPVVGQEGVRDRLWTALTDVVMEQRLRVCTLSGGPKAPLSDLPAWLGSRAAELGVARTIRAYHSEAGGPREGLVGLCEDVFGTWALEAHALEERLEEAIAGRVPGRLARSVVSIVAGELARARGIEDRALIPTSLERHRAVAVALESFRDDRALILWVENAEHGADSLAFVRHLIQRADHLPVLVVVTRTDEPGRGEDFALREVADLESYESVDAIAVPDYSRDELREMVGRLLPANEEVADRILDLAASDRVVARVLMTHLVAEESLVPVEGGFELRECEFPGSRAELLECRVRAVCGGDRTVRSALEVAAVLGRAPDPDEIREVSRELGLEPRELGAVVVEGGLARRLTGDRWAFAHKGFLDVLTSGAAARQRLSAIHAASARVLERRTTPGESEEWRRIAEHWVAAGEAGNALEPLYVAARLMQSSTIPGARELARRRRGLLEHLSLSKDSAAAIDQLNIEASIRRSEGDVTESRAAASDAEALARQTGYDRGLSYALRHLARLAVDVGDLEGASRRLVESSQVSSRVGEPIDQARSMFNAAYLDYRGGRLERAEQRYRQAIDLYGAEGAVRHQARAMSYLSALMTTRDELPEAREWAERAMKLARDAGALSVVADATSDLAEILRFSGRYEDARELYVESRSWAQSSGLRAARVFELNIALADLALGRASSARETLCRIREEFVASGIRNKDDLLRAGIGVAALAEGDVDAFESECGGLLEEEPRGHRDLAWIWELGTGFAAEFGRADEAARLAEAGAAEYEALGLHARAASVRRG